MSPKQRKLKPEASEDAFSETPRVLSDEEKRQLILAHASVRAPKDPVQRATMWAGMFVALAVIFGGWWLSVGRNIQKGVEGGDRKDWKAMEDRLDQFTDQLRTDTVVNAPNIPLPTSEASAAEDAGMVRAVIGEESERADRDDLFGISGVFAPTTSSASVQEPAVEQGAFIDPNDPGLTLESLQ